MGTSGLMSGDGKRGGATVSVPAPILDSTLRRVSTPAFAHTATIERMSSVAGVSVEEYLSTAYRSDCDYVDGEVRERNVGEYPHSGKYRITATAVGFAKPRNALADMRHPGWQAQ